MANHVIHFYAPVTQVTVQTLTNTVLTAVHERKATSIELRISSEGGNLTAGFTAYNVLKALDIPVSTHNLSNVESIAIVIFLAGQTRLVVPHGRFMLHSLHWTFAQQVVDHARLAEHVASLDRDADRYASIYEERTSGAAKQLDVRTHLHGPPLILSPQDAVDAGICTGIAEPKDVGEDTVHWWVTQPTK